MKTHRQFEVDVLRMVLASVHNREIEKRGKSGESELTEEEIIEVLRKEAKKRKEAMEIYEQAGRGELSNKEKRELAIIESYLPRPLDEAEIEAVVKEVIDSGTKDFGQIMKAVISRVGGRAEARVLSEIVKKLLA